MEGFKLCFPTLRQQSIVFYVYGCYSFVALRKIVDSDPLFVELFPYAVMAFLSVNPDISITPLPTHVCAAIKAKFSRSQFRYFLRKYIRSPEQKIDPLFGLLLL